MDPALLVDKLKKKRKKKADLQQPVSVTDTSHEQEPQGCLLAKLR